MRDCFGILQLELKKKTTSKVLQFTCVCVFVIGESRAQPNACEGHIVTSP